MANEPNNRQETDGLVKAYVTGIGWAWMSDGEIFEVICQEEETEASQDEMD